jgi:hypothetical protein
MLQEIIVKRFPFLKCYLKAIDTVIANPDNKKIKNLDDRVKPSRIGAFEIYVGVGDRARPVVLHSKLHSKSWPSIPFVLEKIQQNIRPLELNVTLYSKDKGYDLEEKPEKEEDLMLISELDAIKVNLYKLHIETVSLNTNAYNENISGLIDVHKRKEMMHKSRVDQLNENPSLARPYSTRPEMKRPNTGVTQFSTIRGPSAITKRSETIEFRTIQSPRTNLKDANLDSPDQIASNFITSV